MSRWSGSFLRIPGLAPCDLLLQFWDWTKMRRSQLPVGAASASQLGEESARTSLN